MNGLAEKRFGPDVAAKSGARLRGPELCDQSGLNGAENVQEVHRAGFEHRLRGVEMEGEVWRRRW